MPGHYGKGIGGAKKETGYSRGSLPPQGGVKKETGYSQGSLPPQGGFPKTETALKKKKKTAEEAP